jgi:hypothetical protein
MNPIFFNPCTSALFAEQLLTFVNKFVPRRGKNAERLGLAADACM